jgi:O-antigen/teichoic acid export membrane protein
VTLVRQFIIYGVGGAASRLAAIFLVPLYTRTLTVHDYGQLEVLLVLHALAVLLVGVQSESAVARDFHDARIQGTDHRLAWAAIVVTAAGSAALPLLALPAAWLGWLPRGVPTYLPWLVAMAVPAQLLGIQLVLLRFSGAATMFATLSFLDLTLSAVISAVLIVGCGLGITGALAGIVISKGACVAIAWPATFGRPHWGRPSPSMLRKMLAYALPTMPSVLLNWLQTNGNRVLLASFLTLRDVAIAGVAIKVAALYGFLVFSFRLAWEPYSFQRLSDHEQYPGGLYRRAFEWYALGMFLIAGLTTAASPFIVAILAPPEYADAAHLVGLFVIGQFWMGSITILAIGIHGARITSRLTHVYGIGAVLNVAALVALTPLIGVAAAGVGFLGGSLASAWLAAWYSDRHFGVGFGRRLLAVVSAASVIFVLVALLLDRLTVRGGADAVLAAVMTGAATVTAVALMAGFGIGTARIPSMGGDLSHLIRPKVRKA